MSVQAIREEQETVERFRAAWPAGNVNAEGFDVGADVVTYVLAQAEGAVEPQGWHPRRLKWARDVAFLMGLIYVMAHGYPLTRAGQLLAAQEAERRGLA